MKYEISEEFLFCVSNEFVNNLQDSDLWLPLYKTQDGHESWLKTLIYNILKSIDRPRYIQIIIQLCEKKVNYKKSCNNLTERCLLGMLILIFFSDTIC